MKNAALFASKKASVGSTEIDVLPLIADAVICTDENGRILLFNRAAEKTFGYAVDEVLGQSVEILLPERFRSEHARQVHSFVLRESGAGRLMGQTREVWGRRKTGEEFPAEATISRQIVNDTTVLTVVHRDISERKILEEQRDAIASELDHRIRNLFAVVNSLVRLSSRGAATVEDFKESLLRRLSALVATQTALRSDAANGQTLRELLLAEVEQYRNGNDVNVIVEGPPVKLRPLLAQSLALVFHELATNSSKYGALSVDSGKVSVTSRFHENRDQRALEVEWCETGGPPVARPERQGFGTALIKQVIGRTLRGDVTFDYARKGFSCGMSFSSDFLAAEGAE